jgi:hypothetical protein
MAAAPTVSSPASVSLVLSNGSPIGLQGPAGLASQSA